MVKAIKFIFWGILSLFYHKYNRYDPTNFNRAPNVMIKFKKDCVFKIDFFGK